MNGIRNAVKKSIYSLAVIALCFGTGTAFAESGGHGSTTEASGHESAESGLPILNDLGIHVSGFVDTAYSHNFNNPGDNTNHGRVFDVNDDSFTLHQAQMVFERHGHAGGSHTNRAGFELRLGYGEDARVFAAEGTDRDDEFDILEAFMTYALSNTLSVKVGKYATLLGAEVIESKDNWNFSRSYLFGFAIPFDHTGIRLTYTPSDMWEFNIGVNNGWDNLSENNSSKTLEFNAVLNLPHNVSWSNAIVFGDEHRELGEAGAEAEIARLARTSFSPISISPSDLMIGATAADVKHDDQRIVYDSIITYQPHKQWTLMANFDYGSEQGTGKGGSDSEWVGVAGYTHYDATDRLGLTVRSEIFDDMDGARTGIEQTLFETTLTAGYKLTPAMETRLEYRYDASNHDDFFGQGEDNQSTIAAELIFTF